MTFVQGVREFVRGADMKSGLGNPILTLRALELP
jgi:hypothetical protein